MKITEYFIVASDNASDLEQQVTGLIEQGWEIKGGARLEGKVWYQTLVKRA